MTAEQLRYAARGCCDAPVLVVYHDDVGNLRVAELDTARVVPDHIIAEDYGVEIENRTALVLIVE